MPFRLGKGNKKNEEVPEPVASEDIEGTTGEAVADSQSEETQGPKLPSDETPPVPEADDAQPAREETPAPAPANAFQFRPSYLDPAPAERKWSRRFGARPQPAAEEPDGVERSIVVIVRDEAGQPLSVDLFEKPNDARAHVELCLETGTAEDRITVFRASTVPVQVVHRPSVRLVPQGE